MRHKLAIAALVLGLAIVVLAESDEDGGSLRGLVDAVLNDFNKACSDADAEYEKKISPVIKQHNLKRVSQIHTAGKDAMRKLNKVAADARKNESPVGEALAKDGMAYVDKTMGESEVPLPIGEIWRLRFEGHHYLAIMAPVTWDQAATLCKKMGGHLVYIETNEEMDFIQKITSGISMYVGATDKQRENDWRWLSGRKVSRSFWMSSRPMQNYKPYYGSMLLREGLMDISPSSMAARGFICEWDK